MVVVEDWVLAKSALAAQLRADGRGRRCQLIEVQFVIFAGEYIEEVIDVLIGHALVSGNKHAGAPRRRR